MAVLEINNLKKISVFLESIKFSHTVFALPFALVSMLSAAGGLPSLSVFFWIVIACVFARTAAMAFNRLADRQFDARNPRTQSRALVTGELSTSFMAGALALSSALFVLAAAMLNETCFFLSFPTLAVLLGYSLTKRFTNYSHYFLGLALGLAPLGAWIAVREDIAWTPVILSLAVIFWVAGFDILYSCQDVEIDRTERELHSAPKRYGVAGAMRLARWSHAAALALFFSFWAAAGLGVMGLAGVIAIGALLSYQHRLVSPRDLSRIDAAFFSANGAISLTFLALVAAELLAL